MSLSLIGSYRAVPSVVIQRRSGWLGRVGVVVVTVEAAFWVEAIYLVSDGGDGLLDEAACVGDLTGDGRVDLQDLVIQLGNYATRSGASPEDGDLDGDGDQDVLSASSGDGKIAWYENTDGMGAFGPEQTITTSLRATRSVFAVVRAGGGDQDLPSASRGFRAPFPLRRLVGCAAPVRAGRGRLLDDDFSKASPEPRSATLPPEHIAISCQGKAIVAFQVVMFGSVSNYGVLD